jgi:hypothetical protein
MVLCFALLVPCKLPVDRCAALFQLSLFFGVFEFVLHLAFESFRASDTEVHDQILRIAGVANRVSKGLCVRGKGLLCGKLYRGARLLVLEDYDRMTDGC